MNLKNKKKGEKMMDKNKMIEKVKGAGTKVMFVVLGYCAIDLLLKAMNKTAQNPTTEKLEDLFTESEE